MSNEEKTQSSWNDDELDTSAEGGRLDKVLDTQRWLMNNGFLNDMVKDQLYMYGAIVHRNIEAVELDADVKPTSRVVNYRLYISTSLLSKHKNFLELRDKESLWSLWKFRKILRKEGNLDFNKLISNFVNDFLGPSWESKVEVKDIAEYVDGYDEEEKQSAISADGFDQQPDS